MDKYVRNNKLTKLAIIMCTKNGESFIIDQLASIKNQSFKNYDLYISDNNSDDNTIKNIQNFIKKYNMKNIYLINGRDKNFAFNFIWLAKRIKKEYSYYAFCDQDDIWLENHLDRGIKKMSCLKDNLPILFCSATNLIDSKGKLIGESYKFKKPPNLKNSLVQSIAGGNTMIFNSKSFDLLKNINIKKRFIPSHDWVLYNLVAACNGKVIYSTKPTVQYRQHKNNIIGSNKGFIALLKRAFYVLDGRWKVWIDANINIILDERSLQEEIRAFLNKIKHQKNSKNIFKRIKFISDHGLYRQTFLGNVSLFILALLNKL